jgi:GntR family transcriptional regulator
MQINLAQLQKAAADSVMSTAVTMVRTQKDEPAYKRIQSAIRQRIDSGELKPGDVVDSERELARIHSVSLMTARHALADLAQEGIVERRHGAGNFCRAAADPLQQAAQLHRADGEPGPDDAFRIVSSGIVITGARDRGASWLVANSRLIKIERVRSAGDEPVALEICYLSAEEYQAVMEAHLSEHRCLERWSASAALNSRMPMRRSTRPMPIIALPVS